MRRANALLVVLWNALCVLLVFFSSYLHIRADRLVWGMPAAARFVFVLAVLLVVVSVQSVVSAAESVGHNDSDAVNTNRNTNTFPSASPLLIVREAGVCSTCVTNAYFASDSCNGLPTQVCEGAEYYGSTSGFAADGASLCDFGTAPSAWLRFVPCVSAGE